MADNTVKLEVEFDDASAQQAAQEAERTMAAEGTTPADFAKAAAAMARAMEQFTARLERTSGIKGGGSSGGSDRRADSIRFKRDLLNSPTPQDRIELLKANRDLFDQGTPEYEQAALDLAREQRRQEKTAERDAAKQQTLAERQQAKAAKDQERQTKAAERAQQAAALRQQRQQAAAQRNAQRAQLQAQRQAARAGGGPGFLQRIGGFGTGGIGGFASGNLGGMALAGAAAAQFGRGVGNLAGGAASGDPSQFLKGVFTTSTGMLFGKLVEKFADAMDRLVEDLGQYSVSVTQKQAELEIATENLRWRMADASEGLMDAWQDLKLETLALMDDLMPVIKVGIEALSFFVDVLRSAIDGLRKVASVLGISSGGEGSKEKSPIRSSNDAFMSDLGGTSSGTQSPAGVTSLGPAVAAAGGGGVGAVATAAAASAPQIRLPGGGGVGFNLQQSNRFEVLDRLSVEMVLNDMRELILDPLRQQGDTVSMIGSLASARLALAYAG